MSDRTQDESLWPFIGIDNLQYTQIPDIYIDVIMPRVSGAEWKVLCYIARRTFGWKKTADNISLAQLMHGITTRDGIQLDGGTGLSQNTVITALKGLVDKGLITATRRSTADRGDIPTTYAPKFRPGVLQNVDNSSTPVLNNERRGTAKTASTRPQKHETQQTTSQQTIKQEHDVPRYSRYEEAYVDSPNTSA